MTSALARLSLVTSDREIGRGRRIAFPQHDLKAGFLGVVLVGGGDADAVGAVFVDERDLDVLGLHAELGLGILGDEAREGLAVLVGMDLRAEDVFQVLVLEHGGRDRGRDPEDLLLLLHLGGERDRVRARIDAVDDVDLLLVDQALDLVDRDIGLALRIGVDRRDLVFAADAAASRCTDRSRSARRSRRRPSRRPRTAPSRSKMTPMRTVSACACA